MKPHILLAGFGLFLVSLLIHAVVWRIKRPKHQASGLFCIFFLPLVVLLPLCFTLCPTSTPANLTAATLLYLTLSSAYILIYPAFEADNLSLRILILIQQAIPGGMSESEILNLFSQSQLFEARISDLLTAGLVYQLRGKLALTRRGRSFIFPFIMLRKILGLPPGAG